MDYDKERYFLFTQSYVAGAIAEAIRAKHSISNKQSSSDWLKRLLDEHFSLFEEKWKEFRADEEVEISSGFVFVIKDEIESKIIPEVRRVADMFGFSEKMLMLFVIYGNVPHKLVSRCGIYRASELSPIKYQGTYLRVDETTSNKEVLGMLKEAKKYMDLTKHFKEEETVTKETKKVEKKRKDVSKLDGANGAIYIAVENKIKKLVLQKKEKGKRYNYNEQIVMPAIEQVVGDTMTKEKWGDESIGEEVRCIKLIKDVYYSIIERYRLPTYKDLKLISRVINS